MYRLNIKKRAVAARLAEESARRAAFLISKIMKKNISEAPLINSAQRALFIDPNRDGSANLEFFIKNHKDLCKLYLGQFVLINNQSVVYASETFEDVLMEAIYRKFPTHYAIYPCTGSSNDYTTDIPKRCRS